MSKSTPAAPDYAGAANAQAEASREVTEQQTWANRPTINTPFGQQTWSVTPQWDPSTGQYLNTWTQNTNLTPESQAALDSQMRIQQGRSGLAESLLGRAQDEYGDTMDWSKFDQLAATPGSENIQRNISTDGLQTVNPADRYSQEAEDAIYNQWSNRMDPQFQRDADQLRTQLHNSGLKEGDQAYDIEMEKLRQSQGDARTNAQYQATIGAGEEASRMFGMDSSSRAQGFQERQAGGAFANSAAQQAYNQSTQSANYQNQRRQQQIAEEMQRRGFSLNEINAILTGQQVGMPSMPGFNTAQRSEGGQFLDAAQMQGQAAIDQFNAQQQQQNSMLSGIAGGAMMFSDRRLKIMLKELGVDTNGLKKYSFYYIWEVRPFERVDIAPHIGYMADEVEKLYPDCVLDMHGYKVVDYSRIPGWQ
jgi:DNA-binding transcriptional MerR regulator